MLTEDLKLLLLDDSSLINISSNMHSEYGNKYDLCEKILTRFASTFNIYLNMHLLMPPNLLPTPQNWILLNSNQKRITMTALNRVVKYIRNIPVGLNIDEIHSYLVTPGVGLCIGLTETGALCPNQSEINQVYCRFHNS